MPAPCCKEFYKKIPDEVPVFTVVGWDIFGTKIIRNWISLALENDVPVPKIQKVLNHLIDFEKFAQTHPELMKLPD